MRRFQLMVCRPIMVILEPDANFEDILERHYAKQIVELLGELPLALDQAGAYIFSTDSSFKSYYVDQLKENPRDFKPKFWEGGVVSRDTKMPTSHKINTVWRVSFDALNDDAKNLLRILSFIGNDDIPQEMIKRNTDKKMLSWLKGMFISISF
jgi:hypothetical protein